MKDKMLDKVLDKIAGWAITALAVAGVLRMMSGVLMIEQAPAADISMTPYIIRAFAGLAVILVAMMGQAVREHIKEDL